MADTEDLAPEGPETPGPTAADATAGEPAPPTIEQLEVPLEMPAEPADDDDLTPQVHARKPGLYLLRPMGIRPAPRGVRRRRSSLRNDCPPDMRRPGARPSPRPRLR